MLSGDLPVKIVDEEKIKKEATNRLKVILEEINQPDFSRLYAVDQARIYNTLRFSVKECFSIGAKDNDKVDRIVQTVLWPKAYCTYPLTPTPE